MDHTIRFAIVLAIALSRGASIVAVLYRPLSMILTDLRDSEERGRFWTVCSSIIIKFSPVLAVAFAMIAWPDPAYDPLRLQRCVFWSTLALVIALIVFENNLWSPSSRRFDAEQAECAHRPWDDQARTESAA